MDLRQSGFSLSSFPWLSGIKGDLRYAFRALRRDRAFTSVAIVSLALGIGANAAIFTLTDTLLWRELPVQNPERLVVFENTSRSYFAYSEFAKHSSAALESVLASGGPIAFPIDVGSGPKASYLAEISGNYFEALGVNALMGRLIKPDDDRFTDPKSVAVLSNTFWHRSFDASPSVIGRSIWVNKGRFTVIGIAPPEFFGVSVGEAPDVWIPLSAQPRAFPGTHWLTMRSNNFLTILGRLRPGVTLRRAESILQSVSIEIDIQRNGKPRTAADQRALYENQLVLLPATKGISYLRDQFSKPLHVVFFMVLIVLLLASINVTSLQLARADERHKEISVRLAIGASRFRVVRQLLVESMILACAGSLLGLALCRPSVSALASLMTLWGNEPARLELHFHPNLLMFVLSIAVVVALLSGLAPALYTMRRNLQPGLQQTSLGISTARGSRFAGRLVAALQLAISLVLITGTCLFAVSLHKLRSFDSGIRRERLLQVETDPQAAGYKDRQTVDLNIRLRDRFLRVPGVETVSFTQNGIYAGRNYSTSFRADGFHPSNTDATYASYDHVGPKFFTTLGTAVLAGRDFENHDNAAAAKVAIINREFARRVFPNGNAVGRNIYVDGAPYGIIGVVREIRNDVRRPEPMFYLPQLQTGVQVFSTQFLVRGKGSSTQLIPDLRAAVRAEDRHLLISEIQSADRLFDGGINSDRFLARLAWGFGLLALALTSVGIYGLLSYEVTRRTGEIGVRMAVGALRADIVRLVFSELFLVFGAGFALGSVAASSLSKFVSSLVFGLKAADPRLELAAGVILRVTAICGAYFPSRRATRVDPMTALRNG